MALLLRMLLWIVLLLLLLLLMMMMKAMMVVVAPLDMENMFGMVELLLGVVRRGVDLVVPRLVVVLEGALGLVVALTVLLVLLALQGCFCRMLKLKLLLQLLEGVLPLRGAGSPEGRANTTGQKKKQFGSKKIMMGPASIRG